MFPEHSEQADVTTPLSNPADSSTSAEEGSSAPFVQNAAPTESVDAKNERISQKKWQEMAEKAKQFDAMNETFGIKPGENPVAELQKQIADLKSESLRKEFEAQVPVVRNEQYAEKWTKINKEKGHLVQKGELTHADLWKIIRDEGEYQQRVAAVQETQKEEQEAFSGSVPFFGNSISAQGSDKLTQTDKEIAKAMGWSEKTYQAAGVL